jgi:sugar phosphate isomerase/epimerase
MERDRLSRRKAIARTGIICGSALTSAYLPAEPARAEGAVTEKSGHYVYCLNTGTIRGQKLGLAKEIEVAAKAGYQAIEPWISSIEEYAKGGGSLRELRQRISERGLTVESAIGFTQWIVDDDAARAKGLERIKVEMDMLAQIGGKRLATPPSGATDKPGLDLMKAAERYRALLELGDQMGVVPQLELWGFSRNLHRLGQCLFVAIETGHPKACVLADVFHIYKGGSSFHGLSLISAKALQVFHLNDYPSDPPRDKINDSFRVYPGDGSAPLTPILRDLYSTGGQKVLSLELFNRKYWEQDALEVARTGLEKMQTAVKRALD